MLQIRKKANGLFLYVINGNEIYDSKIKLFIANNSLSVEYGISKIIESFSLNQIDAYDDTGAGTSIPFADWNALAVVLNTLGVPNFTS